MSQFFDNSKAVKLLAEHRRRTHNLPEDDPERVNYPAALTRMVVRLCDRYTSSGKWSGYSYRDELKQEAVLSCFCALGKFDPSRSNIFSYLTTVASNACLKFRNGEAKERLARLDYVQDTIALEELDAEERVRIDASHRAAETSVGQKLLADMRAKQHRHTLLERRLREKERVRESFAFECPHCPARFREQRHLRLHMTLAHSGAEEGVFA